MSRNLLEMAGVTKRFPGVVALDNVSFDVRPGEVHCLAGENGAGKSTLMKILSGALAPDSGELRLNGKPTVIDSPHHAQNLGISMIYQEFNLSPFQSVAENIFLGREPRRPGTPFIDWPRMRRDAAELLSQIGAAVDVRRAVRECSVAEQQLIEIAKALAFESRVLIMDEPSATLTEHELNRLFGLIRNLKAQGLGIVYISHRLDEIFAIAGRVTVLRDGKHVSTRPAAECSRDGLIRDMVGRELTDEYPKETFETGPERLRIEGLTRNGAFEDISFSLHQGEIVAMTGLVGAGRTEIARAIFGADPIDAGAIYLDGRKLALNSPRDAIRAGIGLLTEDRKHQGLVAGMNIRENMTLANLPAVSRGPFIALARERRQTARYAGDLDIRTPSTEQTVQNLSGGNQQKVVLAKWLFTHCRVLIFDEPTRGIDIGAKVAIYQLINDLVRNGVGVLLISSELPEVLGLADRILVLHRGRLAGTLSRNNATQEKLLHLATGSAMAGEAR